jgi:hypothetical protein
LIERMSRGQLTTGLFGMARSPVNHT